MIPKRVSIPMAVLALTFWLAGCSAGNSSSGSTNSSSSVANIQLSPSSPQLSGLGKTLQFTATAYDGSGTALSDVTFTWASSNASVATIGSSGLATSVAAGVATVTAAASGVTSNGVTLTVTDPVASIVVTPASPAISGLGNTQQLTATAYDASGNTLSGIAFTWASSNPSVATTGSSGLATSVAPGTTTITAAASGITSTGVILTVTDAVASISVTPASPSIAIGNTQQFAAAAHDSVGNQLSGVTFTWASTNTSVAAIGSSGLATSVGAGTTSITATAGGVTSNGDTLTVKPTYSIGGTISGLTASGLVLANGGQTVSPAANSTSFTFPTAVASGASYAVTVTTQPSGLTCSVTNGSGTITSSNIIAVQVACVSSTTYTIGGTIGGTGLTTSGLVLADGSQTVSPAANSTSFTFPTAVASGASYAVTVQAQPTNELCTVANGSGTVASSNVTTVAIACNPTYTVGGTISGLTVSGLVLAMGSQTVSPAAGAASFTFPDAVVYAASYSVTVDTQPEGQSCFVENGSGVASANVVNVQVICQDIEAVLYSFGSFTGDGTTPVAGLVMDASGNLYGTTQDGGAYGSSSFGGTVFKLTSSGNGSYTESLLHSFEVASGDIDGYDAQSGLVMDASGDLFGTTSTGTVSDGVVYELTPSGGSSYTETLLYNNFGGSGAIVGEAPFAGLLLDSSGNLYGTAPDEQCGTVAAGDVFELSPSGPGTYAASSLFVFPYFDPSDYSCNAAPPAGDFLDGSAPVGGLVMDAAGNLYGTTQDGGAYDAANSTVGEGTVYKLTPAGAGTYTESVLYSFGSFTGDGTAPVAGLTFDAAGNLYGTTPSGGAYDGAENNFSNGAGSVFKLTPSGNGAYTETILYNFGNPNFSGDGIDPVAGLILDAAGNLYGTTITGGANGEGAVFKLTPSGNGAYTETILYNFGMLAGYDDGARPAAGLIMDAAGNLYGTTDSGGVSTNGSGTAFAVYQTTASGTYPIGGTISGLTAGGLVLANGVQTVYVPMNATAFSFYPYAVASGSSYSVTVQTQPSGETCTVTDGSGTVNSSNISNVQIACVAP